MRTKLYSIFLSVTLIVLSLSVKSQTVLYDTCSEMRSYQGEWAYSSGQESVKIYLRAHIFYNAVTAKYSEEILGWHEYSVNNVIVQSDYSHRFDSLPQSFMEKVQINYSIAIGFLACSNPLNKLYGAMKDYQKNNRRQNWTVTRLSATSIQVRQIQGEGLSTVQYIPGYTLPQTFVLTKQ